ncbi:MAG: sigma-54 dependent transcriptional regulator [Fibromonadaceae bacterium]|jgi:transcriptional regulator with PAS, ATPase and Fis domain|nr:sigma-54 dependent transcriptional regulator [Fibromonadaceae bacterium]
MNEGLNFKKMLKIAAQSDIPVLLTGESGSGKEVAARSLHYAGKRKNRAFVAVNCGAISPGLAESLFCGHSKGAFTGASSEQQGFVKAANGGTLFLDEVAELSLDIQKTLLRVLQEKSVIPVGEQREIKVDFRLVCATHRDLPSLVAKGCFREDLYFRISTMPIRIPPLRERLCDLRSIAESIWQGSEPLSNWHLATLQKYSWPGNIRQLKNVLERYALLKNHGFELDSLIEAEFEHCRFSLRENPPKYRPSPIEINEEIQSCNGNKSHAAKKLGISRSGLYYKMRKTP